MKVGDLIYDSHFEEHGIVIEAKPCEISQGEWCTILYEDGSVVASIRSWEESIEVINESR